MCVLNLLTACWHSSPWISHFFLWQPLPLNTLMYFILRELYVLLFPVSPCDPCLCLFLLHILDFLNHPADHHLVWPDTTLKSPIHFQTAPSASAYHVFNLYSRPAPPHTHTHSHAVKCVQNPKPTSFLSLSSHLPNTSLSPRFPSHMSTEIWSSHQSQPPGDTLFHFIQFTAEVPRHCTHLCRRPRKKHHLHNRITTLPRL